jgi:hypothetical protein
VFRQWLAQISGPDSPLSENRQLSPSLTSKQEPRMLFRFAFVGWSRAYESKRHLCIACSLGTGWTRSSRCRLRSDSFECQMWSILLFFKEKKIQFACDNLVLDLAEIFAKKRGSILAVAYNFFKLLLRKFLNTRRPVAVIFDRYLFIKIRAMFQKFFLRFLTRVYKIESEPQNRTIQVL